jgi:HAMP domain-containing protein
VVVSALKVDSGFVAQLRRNTDSEIVFFSLDTTFARFPLRAGDESYLGASGFLRTADGVPLGGFLALHSRDQELAAYRQLSRTIGWSFVVGLLLALGFSVLMARRITRPVRQLVRTARKVSEGQYTGRIEASSGDEIGELAGAFGQMVEELREKDRLVEYLKTGGQRGSGAAGRRGRRRRLRVEWTGRARWRWVRGSRAATMSRRCWARAEWAWFTARSIARSGRRWRSRRYARISAGSIPPRSSGSSRS